MNKSFRMRTGHLSLRHHTCPDRPRVFSPKKHLNSHQHSHRLVAPNLGSYIEFSLFLWMTMVNFEIRNIYTVENEMIMLKKTHT